LDHATWSAETRARHAPAGTTLRQRNAAEMLHPAATKTHITHMFCPPLNSHKGRRGSLGVLMAETGDSTQRLAKTPTPVSILRPLLPHGEKGEFERPEAQNERRSAETSQKPAPV